VAGLAAAAVLIASVVVIVLVTSRPAPITVRDLRIPVVDGPHGDQRVVLDATFLAPAGAGRVPAILLAHGFGETKAAVRPEAEQLARAGFAVLTWTARGFGDSTGQVALDSPDYEVKDVEQLVTWLAGQARVLLDRPGDPRVGIAGASYGGGIALLAAAYDHRIDAIVPQSTWNSLATALFPNAAGGSPAGGIFKKQWAGLLFAQGAVGFGNAGQGSNAGQRSNAGPGSGASGSGTSASGSGTSASGSGASASGSGASAQGSGPASATALANAAAQAARCGRFLPRICAIYQQVATDGKATPQAISLLQRSSPASAASQIDVPTLLIQGENDSLFGLDQANANYQAIRHNGAPVDMVWFNGGHDGGDQETSRVNALTQQWFEHWLMPAHLLFHPGSGGAASTGAAGRSSAGLSTGQPGFAVSRDRGFDPSSNADVLGVATAAAYPGLGGTTHTTVRLTGPPQTIVNPAGGAPASMSVFPGLGSLASSGLAFDMPGQSAAFTSAPLAAPVRMTGSASVTVRVGGAPDITLFAKVYDVDQAGNATLPDQLAAPVRVVGAPAGRVVRIRLPAIDYRFAAGHQLRLVLTATDFAYTTSPAPATYQVALAAPGLSVPADPALTIAGGGVPWWAWAAPIAALAAAAMILTTRRRRVPDTPVPELIGVPLEITGLTKRYRDGQLAVDDLSLRVDSGQILGLLGPNGAGKTSTLRALMGLIRPDTGTITIFGRRVQPGAPALSRLGSFVEGPGFLPHLSGRDNLDLYWRATGRPAADAHMAEVLEVAGLGAAIDRRVGAYSRGMRQRLAIAQAMLGLPDLLVLDEPMNGLDPPQIREMRDVLLRYAADGRTVILSSHMLAEVEQTCSHVVVMHLGRRLAAGTVREIIGDGAALVVGTAEAERAVTVLRELGGIESAEPHQDGVIVQPNGLATSAVVAALVGAGIPVDRVAPSRRLEDAFLALIAAPSAEIAVPPAEMAASPEKSPEKPPDKEGGS
jgi:ABC-2 type transport system ATP-binding protein